MDAPAKVALAEAVNALVTDTAAKTLYSQMLGVLEVAARIPVQLVGRPAVLNLLLRLALEDEPAYERVLDLIDRKRTAAGLPPLRETRLDRRAYMREFMAQRRERLRRLVDLFNALRSETDQLRGQLRLKFEQVHGARWIAEKDRREEATRAKLGRRLTADERLEISTVLWNDVEEELAALGAFVRDEMHKPLYARSNTGFPFTVGVMPGKEK